jgi:hypothetical protein
MARHLTPRVRKDIPNKIGPASPDSGIPALAETGFRHTLKDRAERLEAAYRWRVEAAYRHAQAEGAISPFDLTPESENFARQLVHAFLVGRGGDVKPSALFELNRWTRFFVHVLVTTCREKTGVDRERSIDRKVKILDDYALELYYLREESRSEIRYRTLDFINKAISSMGHAATDLNAAADELGLSKERAFEALKREAAEAARETTARTEEPPRPDWIEAHKRGVEVPEFIEKTFAAELADDAMHKGLFDRYKNLRRDFHAYQRHHELPAWLKAIPTQKEWKDRQPPEAPAPLVPLARTDDVRRYEREAKRARHQRQRALAASVS